MRGAFWTSLSGPDRAPEKPAAPFPTYNGQVLNDSVEISRLRARVAALEAAAEINKLVCGELPIILWTTDRELTFTWCAGGVSGTSGFDAEDVVGVNLLDFFRTTDVDFPPVAASNRALRGEAVRYEHEWQDRRLAATVAPLYSEGQLIGTVGIAVDMTARTETEEVLHSFEARYRDLFDNVADIVFAHDLSGRFSDMNRAGRRLFGYSQDEISDMWLEDVIAPESKELAAHMLHAQLRAAGPLIYEVHALSKDGERLTLEFNSSLISDSDGLPVAVQIVARETGERRRIEDQLRQSQKNEAVAMLAGGVARELTELVAEVLANGYLLKGRVRESGASGEAVARIIGGAERASELVDLLIAFGRQTRHEAVPVDVHAVLRRVALLLARTTDPRIRIVTTLDADRPGVVGDEKQLQQVFLSLGVNAREAMPDGGELRISTSTRDRQLEIVITDTGAAFRTPSGTVCSIRSSRRSRWQRAPAWDCRSLGPLSKTIAGTYGSRRGQAAALRFVLRCRRLTMPWRRRRPSSTASKFWPRAPW